MSIPVIMAKIFQSVQWADPALVLKQNRITAIASENNLPLIALVQSVRISLPGMALLLLT
jgi:hypothetical protein